MPTAASNGRLSSSMRPFDRASVNAVMGSAREAASSPACSPGRRILAGAAYSCLRATCSCTASTASWLVHCLPWKPYEARHRQQELFLVVAAALAADAGKAHPVRGGSDRAVSGRFEAAAAALFAGRQGAGADRWRSHDLGFAG